MKNMSVDRKSVLAGKKTISRTLIHLWVAYVYKVSSSFLWITFENGSSGVQGEGGNF